MRKIDAVFVAAVLGAVSLLGCGEADDTPPPPTSAMPPPNGQPAAPPGQTMVTIVANSTPPGAMVTGGGRQLGLTPLTTRVPIPTPPPGEVQTFAFTFELAGHRPATINAAPVNDTVSITAALAPLTAEPPESGEGDEGEADEADEPNELRVVGRGGGRIYDNHTTRASAEVEQDCTIDRLRIRLAGNHSYNGDLYITVRDPNGNRYSLHRGASSNPFRGHVVRRAVGREARGRWTLAIQDRLTRDGGQLRGWSLHFRCR